MYSKVYVQKHKVTKFEHETRSVFRFHNNLSPAVLKELNNDRLHLYFRAI
jgi:hypothetical protein